MTAYQGALNEFMEGLDDEQVLELDREREKWVNEAHPVEVQRKTADKMGRNFLRMSAERQYREMGMRSIVWEFHENRAGTKLFQWLSRPTLMAKNLSDKGFVATTSIKTSATQK